MYQLYTIKNLREIDEIEIYKSKGLYVVVIWG